jgi:hypothetical protein
MPAASTGPRGRPDRRGLGLLLAMSLGFGVIAQLPAGRTTTRWLWPIASATYCVGGLFISEVWFGWATQEELQPNIDGLSFDEVLLIGLLSRNRGRSHLLVRDAQEAARVDECLKPIGRQEGSTGIAS